MAALIIRTTQFPVSTPDSTHLSVAVIPILTCLQVAKAHQIEGRDTAVAQDPGDDRCGYCHDFVLGVVSGLVCALGGSVLDGSERQLGGPVLMKTEDGRVIMYNLMSRMYKPVVQEHPCDCDLRLSSFGRCLLVSCLSGLSLGVMGGMTAQNGGDSLRPRGWTR